MKQTRRDWIGRSWFGGLAIMLGGLLVSRRAKAEPTHRFEDVRSRWMDKIHGRFNESGDYLWGAVHIPDGLLRDCPESADALILGPLADSMKIAIRERRQFLLTGKWPKPNTVTL